jgi:hypothetical protein
MQYLVTSPTRVGSHYLLSLLHATGVHAAKTHNPIIKTRYENTCLIIMRRHDAFSAIMSSAIADRTRQYNNYTGSDTIPFEIDCNLESGEMIHRFRYNKWYYGYIPQSFPWAAIENFYFEDVVNNHEYVYNRLNLTPAKPIILPEKSPHKYQDLVINYQECFETFQYLRQHEIRFVPLDKANTERFSKEHWGMDN